MYGTAPEHVGRRHLAETGLDYFGARYFSGAQGRFTTPDPIIVTPARMLDPQRFNLYVYGRNNPLTFVDLDGRDVSLSNDTEEYRRKALYSITKNMTVAEQRNVAYRKNTAGKYEMYLKGPSKIDMSKASEGYQQLANRISNHNLQIDFTLIPAGGSAQASNGDVLRHQTLAGPGGSAGLTYFTPGSGQAEVFVAEGGNPFGVAGLTASGRDIGIAFPEYIVSAHELFGETLKLTPGFTSLQSDPVADSVAAVGVENQIRNFHGLPQRSGNDHANYPVVQSITVTAK